MHPDESEALLLFLNAHIANPEFCTRVSWSKHQVTMWDNRSLSHKGIADDVSERRIVHRVSLRGSRPRGVFNAAEPDHVLFEEVDYSKPRDVPNPRAASLSLDGVAPAQQQQASA